MQSAVFSLQYMNYNNSINKFPNKLEVLISNTYLYEKKFLSRNTCMYSNICHTLEGGEHKRTIRYVKIFLKILFVNYLKKKLFIDHWTHITKTGVILSDWTKRRDWWGVSKSLPPDWLRTSRRHGIQEWWSLM